MSSIEGFERRFFSSIDAEVEKGSLQGSDRDAVKGLFQRMKESGQEAEFSGLLKTLPLSSRSLKILQRNLDKARRPDIPLPEALESLQPLAHQVQELLAYDAHAVAENLFFHRGLSNEVVVGPFARAHGLLRNRTPVFEEASHEIKTRLEKAIPLIRAFEGDRMALKDTAFLARSFSETTGEYAKRWSRTEHQAQQQAVFDTISSTICLSPEARAFYEALYSELAFMRMERAPAAVARKTLKRRLPEPEQAPEGESAPPPPAATPPAVRQRTKSPEVRAPTPPPVEETALPPVPPAQPEILPRAESPKGVPVPPPSQGPLQPQGEAPASATIRPPEVPERGGFAALLLPEGEKVPDLSPTALQTIDKITADLPGLQRGIVRGYMKARAKEHMTEEAILVLKESALRASSGLPEALLRYVDVLQRTLGKYSFHDDELSTIAERLVLHFATVPAAAVQIKAMLLIDSLQCLIDRPETIRGGYIQDKKDAWKKVMGVLKTHRLWQNTLEAVVERTEGATFVPMASPHPHNFPRTKARWPVV